TIAVVGCSSTPGKDAHEIPRFMRERGYQIVPINPFAEEIFGIEAYDDIGDVEGDVDIVDVFRPSEEVPGIVDAVLDRDDCDVVWTQLGIEDSAAGQRLEDAGKRYVESRCLKVEYNRLM
ncbi:MAG: CoA-binding protein, partial [Natronomonas sp.]